MAEKRSTLPERTSGFILKPESRIRTSRPPESKLETSSGTLVLGQTDLVWGLILSGSLSATRVPDSGMSCAYKTIIINILQCLWDSHQWA